MTLRKQRAVVPELIRREQEQEPTDSDYEYPFTDYRWYFRCPNCGGEMLYSSSCSAIRDDAKAECMKCKKTHRVKA